MSVTEAAVSPIVAAARAGDLAAMATALALPHEILDALCAVASRGNVSAMDLLRDRGATPGHFDWALAMAAYTGHVPAMEYARAQCAQPLNSWYMANAAGGGHLAAMQWLRDRGHSRSLDIDVAFASAAGGDKLDAMHLAREWGATNTQQALEWAASSDSLAAMEQIRVWGRVNLNEALAEAARNNRVRAMALLRDWGATRYDLALHSAAVESSLDAMKLARSWGATDYETVMLNLNHKDKRSPLALTLLRKWIALDVEREQHRVIFEATLALTSLSLPTYVLLWITDWVTESPVDTVGLTRYKRVRLIESVKTSIEKVRASR